MKTVLTLAFVFSIILSDDWELFERVKFKTKYSSEHSYYFQYPEFDAALRAREGTDIILEGYFIPYDMQKDNSMILSRYPFAACFFCGGDSGPESVAEVIFAGKKPELELDEVVTVKGKLKLNDKPEAGMTFIVEQAAVVK